MSHREIEMSDDAIVFILTQFMEQIQSDMTSLNFTRQQEWFRDRFTSYGRDISEDELERWTFFAAYIFIHHGVQRSITSMEFAYRRLDQFVFDTIKEHDKIQKIINSAIPVHVLNGEIQSVH